MKLVVIANAVISLGLSGTAVADCANPPYVQDVGGFLGNHTVCVPFNGPPWDAQEYHATMPVSTPKGDFNLIDYHAGPRDPSGNKKDLPNRDPTDVVGNWSFVNNNSANIGGRVTYSYMEGATYTYRLHVNQSGGTVSFCNPSDNTEVAVATIKGPSPAPQPCP